MHTITIKNYNEINDSVKTLPSEKQSDSIGHEMIDNAIFHKKALNPNENKSLRIQNANNLNPTEMKVSESSISTKIKNIANHILRGVGYVLCVPLALVAAAIAMTCLVIAAVFLVALATIGVALSIPCLIGAGIYIVVQVLYEKVAECFQTNQDIDLIYNRHMISNESLASSKNYLESCSSKRSE